VKVLGGLEYPLSKNRYNSLNFYKKYYVLYMVGIRKEGRIQIWHQKIKLIKQKNFILF
jgi:hypothetical protein